MKIDLKHVIGYGVLIIGWVVTVAVWRYETGQLKQDNEDLKEFVKQQVEINAKITYIIDHIDFTLADE